MGVEVRCAVCNKRLGLIYTTCKCQKTLCPHHKSLSEHKCTFDYKTENLEKIKNSLPNLTPLKLEKI